jgi:hypothetical protein
MIADIADAALSRSSATTAHCESSCVNRKLRAVYARHCAPADRPNKNTRSVVRQNIGGARQKLSQ